MNATDKNAFAALIVKTWRFYGKHPEAEDIGAWFDYRQVLVGKQIFSYAAMSATSGSITTSYTRSK